MAKKVHRLPTIAKPPREVPDCNRPLHKDRGVSPGGLPPKPIKPAWQIVGGRSYELHTHS